MPRTTSRRTFLASSAAFSALAATTPLLGQTVQNQAPAPPASAKTPGTPPPAAKPPSTSPPAREHPPLPRVAPPYDVSTINLIGPKPGYSPQVGTLVSMLSWMQLAVIGPTRELSKADLDYLLDKNANSVGALMLHLAATEVLYQRITFNNESFEKFPPDYAAKWGAAMDLGDAGRSTIKGHDIAFYQDTLREVREKTLTELAKRDDAWLLSVDKEPGWGGGPVNMYCLWFHVCEHMSHHAGQIDLIMKRLPGAKAAPAAG